VKQHSKWLYRFTNEKEAKEKTCVLIRQKERLLQEFKMFDFIKKIYPSDANFILVKVSHATGLYKYLLAKNIVVRNRSSQPLCENSLRITVGTPGGKRCFINCF
jgi:histidinol-phosphate aminotransferase